MRILRERTGKSLRVVAHAMNLSAPYISDLENGNRSFNEAMIVRYKEALKS